jgi:heme-degrading monooxygenase HmoA
MAVVKINAIEVPAGAGPELEQRFAARRDAMTGVAGFESFELLRPSAGETRYFVYTRWATEEAFQAWSAGNGSRAAHAPAAGRPQPVSTGASLLEFEVVDLDG